MNLILSKHLLTCASISCRLIWVRVMLEKSIVSEHKQQTVHTPAGVLMCPQILPYDRTQISLTCLFNLRLPRLGGGHDSCGGLRDAAGRLLQTVQIAAVFIRFNLETQSRSLKPSSHSLLDAPEACRVPAR